MLRLRTIESCFGGSSNTVLMMALCFVQRSQTTSGSLAVTHDSSASWRTEDVSGTFTYYATGEGTGQIREMLRRFLRALRLLCTKQSRSRTNSATTSSTLTSVATDASRWKRKSKDRSKSKQT